jgi:hypothetical protein
MPNLALELSEIRSLEEALHRPEIRRSRAALEELLAEGFIEFGSSGAIYHRDEMIDLLVEDDDSGDGELLSYDYSLISISSEAVLLTYRTKRIGNGHERHVLRSSIWKRVGRRWRMLFHQGTVTKPPLTS